MAAIETTTAALVAVPDRETSQTLLLGTARQLQAFGDRLNVFRAFVKDQLQEGIDYGAVGKAKDGEERAKRCLFKAGAEHICQFMDLAPVILYDAIVEDFDRGLFAYRLRCQLVHRATGQVVGEGVGSCNSREVKYRYRTKWWNDKKKDPPTGQGWEQAWGKWSRRVENADTADIANTILKMAKKRALVDAALTVAAASEVFTQDLENLDIDEDALQVPVEASRAPTAQQSPGQAPPRGTSWPRSGR